MKTHLDRLTVLASDHGTITGAHHAAVMAADTAARELGGIVVPYGIPGSTSAGLLSVRAGAITLPADLGRVKLNLDHDRNRPTGYAKAAEDTATALSMTFAVAKTPDGDIALLEAAERTRDAFSYELSDVEIDGDEITAGHLQAVGQVSVPAYTDARVDHIAAKHEGRKATMPCQNCHQVHQDGVTECQSIVAQQGGDQVTATGGDQGGDQVTAAQRLTQALAAAPSLLPGVRPAQRDSVDLDTLYAAMALQGQGVASPEVQAALADITNTGNPYVAPDAYVGELWSGVRYQRRIVPLLSPGTLKSWKVKGWRWVTKPEVADYAGDKAAVPSNAADTEPVETNAARLAGAHDIDRKFYDFGDREFIASYFEAMRESYAVKSDGKAVAFLKTNAPDVGDAADIIKAAAMASAAVEDAVGAPATFVLVNRTNLMSLLDITAQNVSAFLDLFGLTPDRFITHPDVPLNQVIAGHKSAATFYELSGSPIRVEALKVSNGGVDGGVFGYFATLLHDQGGLARVDIGADQP